MGKLSRSSGQWMINRGYIGFWRLRLPLEPTVLARFAIILILTAGWLSGLVALDNEPVDIDLTRAEKEWLANHGHQIVLWFDTGFPPIEFASTSGDFIGLGADIISLVEDKLGVRFLKQPSSDWNRHLKALETGECAIAPTIVATPEREQYTFFTSPYATVPVVIIAGAVTKGRLTLSDLTDKTVAVVSGYATEKYLLEQENDKIQIVPMPNVGEALHSLSFGQVDAYVENLAVAAWYIEQEGIPNLRVAGITDYNFTWRIGVSRKYPLLFNAVEKAVSSISDKEKEYIKKRWVSLEVEEGLSPDTIRTMKLVGLFIAILVFFLSLNTLLLKRRLDEKVRFLKKTREDLVLQSEKLTLALESTRAGVWEVYPETGKVIVNEQWYSMLGLFGKDTEISFEDWLALIHPDDHSEFETTYRDYTHSDGKHSFECEFRMRHRDDSYRWILAKGRAVAWNSHGLPTRMIGLNLDIHRSREIQENLARSEARFRTIFDNAPYSIIINDLETGEFIEANQTFLEIVGKTRDALPGLASFVLSDLVTEVTGQINRELVTTGRSMNRELTSVRQDGSVSHVMCSSVLMELQGKPQVLSMVVDVTEQKKAQQDLEASERRYSQAIMATSDAIWQWNPQTMDFYISPRGPEILGCPGSPSPVAMLIKRCHPDDLGPLSNTFHALLEGSVRETGVAEFRVLSCADEWIWLLGRGAVVERDRLGRPTLLSGTVTDITRRKQLEIEGENLKNQLLQSQKMEAVGILAGGIAHDFNNMLGAIIGYSEILLMKDSPDEYVRENLGHILDAANRSANLTRQLLAFARKQAVNPVVIDLNEAVNGMMKMLRRLIGENIHLKFTPCNDNPRISIDPSQLDQILANLCVNGRDAIKDVGTIIIETGTATFDDQYCARHSGFKPGQFVVLSVSDDGEGMDIETQQRIFEPFFTTKGLGQGTGLGLSTVYGIISQNNGFINVYSEPGNGTTFRLYLPLHSGSAVITSEIDAALPHSHGEQVLLVEDDPVILKMTLIMLEQLGYRVISTVSPLEAVKIAEESAGTINILLTDVVMPDINGKNLSDRIREIIPSVRCIFMSGYTADVIANRGVLFPDVLFLQKPFSIRDLALKLQESIKGAAL